MLKFTPGGQLDNSFGSGGKAFSDVSAFPSAPAIALQPDGKILFGGTSGSSSGQPSGVALARLMASGSADPSFSGDGKLLIGSGGATEGSSLALLPNGHILVAGAAAPNGNADMAIFCLRPEGALDGGFGDGGLTRVHIPGGSGEWARNVQVLADGKILAGGSHFNGFTQVALFRLLGGGLSALPGEEAGIAWDIYPSPARGPSAILRATLQAPAALQFQLFDLQGRLVHSRPVGFHAAGPHEIPVLLPAVPPGLYSAVLQIGLRRHSQWLLIE